MLDSSVEGHKRVLAADAIQLFQQLERTRGIMIYTAAAHGAPLESATGRDFSATERLSRLKPLQAWHYRVSSPRLSLANNVIDSKVHASLSKSVRVVVRRRHQPVERHAETDGREKVHAAAIRMRTTEFRLSDPVPSLSPFPFPPCASPWSLSMGANRFFESQR